jgi:hypothetical protein
VRRRDLLTGVGAAWLAAACGAAKAAFVPIAKPPSPPLPAADSASIATARAVIDISGLPGEVMGGITYSYVVSIPSNTTGQLLYYTVCPNDILANQSSTGFPFAGLCLAVIAGNLAPDTLTGTFSFARTKTGANRVMVSTATLGAGGTFNTTGTWVDTTTVINMLRLRAFKADGTQITTAVFLTPSSCSWNSLGNP